MLKCGETVPGDTALLPVAEQEGVVVYPGSTVQEDITNPCACTHCGTPCDGELAIRGEGRAFCCAGCKLVFELLAENGLGHFYDLQKTPGSRIRSVPTPDQFTYLDEPEVRRRLLNFSDGATARVSFHIPAIHCIACIWLLENLFRLDPAIGSVRVNFPRKEATVCFAEEKLKLSELVRLLASIG
jgi:Cu+-exporting ATPase